MIYIKNFISIKNPISLWLNYCFQKASLERSKYILRKTNLHKGSTIPVHNYFLLVLQGSDSNM
ncbi:hypothetical protein BH11BAC4_BH11BAC4_08050 [soil metagenome]